MPKLWILSAILLTGCAPPEPSFGPSNEALERIGRILEVAPQRRTSEEKRPFDRRPPAYSEARIGLGNALALGDCGLVPLIAERNSALGRQKEDSVRFAYEWRIQAGLIQCAQLHGEAEWFQAALTAKASDLQVAIQRLLFHSPEAEQLRSPLPSGYTRTLDSAKAYEAAFADIRGTLLRAHAGQPPFSDDEIRAFERALKQWGETRHHAALGRAIRESIAWLAAANAAQAHALEINRLCPMGTATTKGRQLQQFITGYFAENIQPEIAAIRQAVASLKALWQVMNDQIPTLNADPEALLLLQPGSLEAFDRHWQTHVRQWQELLAQCDLAPRATTL